MSAAPRADAVDELRAHLRRHPAERDPLQHATGQFHLGGELLDRGDLPGAEEAFAAAAALFRVRGAHAEEAKSLNGLGATLRAAGRLELAARALEHAAAGLGAAGLALDEGAARFNLGLVLRETGRDADAAGAFERAVALLDPAEAAAPRSAALRELGATRLAQGELAEAEEALAAAAELAGRAGDEAARGAAQNALGLALLADGRPGEAAGALAAAAAANPPAVRPEAFAMAKANVALALERTGAHAQARLAARQARDAPGAAEAVREQAAATLRRLGYDAHDLGTALTEEAGDEGRARLVREELLRVVDATDAQRTEAMGEWVAAHTESALEPVAVAELWLGGLLELPPDALERIAASAVAAAARADAAARDTFRESVVRAMARFHIPQWMRLQDVFAGAADAAGDQGAWR